MDVKSDGFVQNIQSGIIRARYREASGKAAHLIESSRVYEYTIDLWATRYVILPLIPRTTTATPAATD